jgi:hypothetical protein
MRSIFERHERTAARFHVKRRLGRLPTQDQSADVASPTDAKTSRLVIRGQVGQWVVQPPWLLRDSPTGAPVGPKVRIIGRSSNGRAGLGRADAAVPSVESHDVYER